MATFSAMTMHYSRFHIVYPEVGSKTSICVIMLQTQELIFLIMVHFLCCMFWFLDPGFHQVIIQECQTRRLNEVHHLFEIFFL
jgi:hypothetical protein